METRRPRRLASRVGHLGATPPRGRKAQRWAPPRPRSRFGSPKASVLVDFTEMVLEVDEMGAPPPEVSETELESSKLFIARIADSADHFCVVEAVSVGKTLVDAVASAWTSNDEIHFGEVEHGAVVEIASHGSTGRPRWLSALRCHKRLDSDFLCQRCRRFAMSSARRSARTPSTRRLSVRSRPARHGAPREQPRRRRLAVKPPGRARSAL